MPEMSLSSAVLPKSGRYLFALALANAHSMQKLTLTLYKTNSGLCDILIQCKVQCKGGSVTSQM